MRLEWKSSCLSIVNSACNVLCFLSCLFRLSFRAETSVFVGFFIVRVCSKDPLVCILKLGPCILVERMRNPGRLKLYFSTSILWEGSFLAS